jgi:hypothetical protein
VPQGNGTPGWLYLTRNPTPIAYFFTRTDNPTIMPVRIVWDERCFEDTVFRVEKTPTHLYLADVWMFNGVPIFDSTTFEERQNLLNSVYSLYTPCPEFESFKVLKRSELNEIRGKEYYTNEKGARGIYCENSDETLLEIVRTDIPDVYKIPSNGDYLRVKTLALSKYLNTMGSVFSLYCQNNQDGTWTPLVDTSSKPITNGTKS